jgi:cell wall-associated NlpC family hydrolase
LSHHQRDLADQRLWEASLGRSRARRALPAHRRSRVPYAAAAVLALAGGGASTLAGAGGMASAQAASSSVAAVQRALGVTADGVIGPVTRRAIRRFQRANGLAATGRLDSTTRAAILSTRTSRSAKKRSDAERFTGPWVAELQQRLGVEPDGVFGPATRKAVRRFQRENGLTPASGAPGPRTLAALGINKNGTRTRTVSQPSSEDTEAGTASSGVQAAVDTARSKLGAPYASGGNGPDSFDCSGLTVYAFKAAGITLPRTSYDQYGEGTTVPRDQIQAGDLVFFNSNGGGASHVGVATGPTTMISATSGGVKENDFSEGYWGEHYVGARRVG